MARGLFSHERNDPDVEWLISNYLESRTDLEMIDISGLPLVLIEKPKAKPSSKIKNEDESIDPPSPKRIKARNIKTKERKEGHHEDIIE